MERTCENCKYFCVVSNIDAMVCMGQKGMPRSRPFDTCEDWKPAYKTNGDAIRQMSDEELADFIARQRFSVVNPIADKLGIDVTAAFIIGRKNALDWLKQELEDD